MTSKTLTIEEYVSLCRGLPMPTQSQMEDYADYISTAHSWYKHLPMNPPGVAFCFFLDPNAGMAHSGSKDGTERVREAELTSHYSSLSTKEYRRKFGYLSCGRRHSTTNLWQIDDQNGKAATIFWPPLQRSVFVPDEITAEGTTYLTALVHPDGLDLLRPGLVLPPESGGQDTVAKIYARCDYLKSKNIIDEPLVKNLAGMPAREKLLLHVLSRHRPELIMEMDYVLYELTAPEQNRQILEMVNAMSRVCQILSKHL